MGQEAADRGRATQQVLLREEQELALELDPMRDADEADGAARAGCVDGLEHRLVGPYALEHGIGAEIAGQPLDGRDAVVAALGDDVRGAVLKCEVLAGRERVPEAYCCPRGNAVHQVEVRRRGWGRSSALQRYLRQVASVPPLSDAG